MWAWQLPGVPQIQLEALCTLVSLRDLWHGGGQCTDPPGDGKFIYVVSDCLGWLQVLHKQFSLSPVLHAIMEECLWLLHGFSAYSVVHIRGDKANPLDAPSRVMGTLVWEGG